MSRRTAEANKAIEAAWLNEQQLVREGKGTRDWTPEQQQDILDKDKGKAYDDDGKAFQGHHMKSVEKYPEYQGDPGNIQFLSRQEHLDAHNGYFRNATNGYYNPTTKETRDFGENKPEPCDPIELSNPVVCAKKEIKDTKKSTDVSNKKEDARTDVPIPEQAAKTATARGGGGFLNSVAKFGKKIVTGGQVFAAKHPVGVAVGTFLGTVAVQTAISIATGDRTAYVDKGITGSGLGKTSFDEGMSVDDEDDMTTSTEESPDEATEKADRASPCGHSVSGYTRHQNGKEVHVNPYKRGGKKKDE